MSPARQNADQNAHLNGRDDHTVPPRSALRSRCSSSARAATEDLPASEVDELADAPMSDQAIIAAHDNSALLHALAVCDFNPMALAEHLGVSPFALLDWHDSEEIQSQLERYHNLERQLLELRAFKSKRLTIEHLEHILETTDDLIEKRRTATTLLRVLSTRRTGGTALRDVNNRARPDLRDGRAAPNRTTPTTTHARPPSASPSEPGSASNHGDDNHRFRQRQAAHSTSESSEIPNPSDAKCNRKSEDENACEQLAKSAPQPEEVPEDQTDASAQDLRAELNWDAFSAESFTGRHDGTPPDPHQRE